MPLRAHFAKKKDLLRLEDLSRLCDLFIDRGIRKIRITGGEPLMRRNLIMLIRKLGRRLGSGGLDALLLTTNGSRLEQNAADLADAGISRINVSLDSLKPDIFANITRGADLDRVLRSIAAASDLGLKIKINMVILRGINDCEVDDMIHWCGDKGYDLSLIETMPMGDSGEDRRHFYRPLVSLKEELAKRWTLLDTPWRSGGPSRYVHVQQTGQLLGFITPLSANFCDSCNRIRLTCTGRVYSCLGHDDHVDFRPLLLEDAPDSKIHALIDQTVHAKPKRHDFCISNSTVQSKSQRTMNMTGG